MKRANANPVGMSAIQRKRNLVKDSLATYSKRNGISEILPARPSDERHPYARLCRIGDLEVGLYLSDKGFVWLYLCARGPDRNLDAEVISACKGPSTDLCLKEGSGQSRNVAKIKHKMDWQQLTVADYDVLKVGCRTLLDLAHSIYGD